MVIHPPSVSHVVGLRSTEKTNGGRPQGGHTSIAGRADMVRRVICGGESARAVAKSVGVNRNTVNLQGARQQSPQRDEEDQG